MTKEELIKALQELDTNGTSGDCEISHLEADGLLIKFINDEEVTKAYDAICKWYA